MEKIYNSLLDLIGSTPLVEVSGIMREEGLKARLDVKLESFNPGGSSKDRIALEMIEDAEQKGIIGPGATIIEPTSGNTGIGLALVGRIKGYRVILTMPETMSQERRNLLKAYGAELYLTPGNKGMRGAIEKAEELKNEIAGSFIPGQFDNPANPRAHSKTTAEEIWRDTDGKVDIFVAGVGTGGTVSGTAETLKKHNPDIQVIAVEPASSPVLEGGKPRPHGIQGIGANFVPKNFYREFIDRIIPVSDEAAAEASRLLARVEGILVGFSSGAAFHAALEEAKKTGNEGKIIVALLPDSGERYLSTDLYS